MLFCIINGLLAMQCLAVQFVNKRASASEKQTERTVPAPERSKEAMNNPWIELGKVNRIFFPFQDGKLLCGGLHEKIFEINLYETTCTAGTDAERIETEFIFFPESFPVKLRYYNKGKLKILYSPNDKENLIALVFNGKAVSVYEWGAKTSYTMKMIEEAESEEKLNPIGKSYTVIILMDNKNKGVYGIVPKKPVLSQSNFVLTAHLSSKRESSTSLWRILEPPAYLLDIITFPIQFIGGFIYAAIFGIKGLEGL